MRLTRRITTIDREQRWGESHAEYLLRLEYELENEITTISEYIYKLTCLIVDESPIRKDLEGALPIFIDLKKTYEKELREIKEDISLFRVKDDKEDNDEGT